MSKKIKVLVIDDEEDYTRLVKLSLESHGDYEVTIQSDPLRALETARKLEPSVVLLDYIMPGMNGGDFANQLANDPALKGTPIIFLTGSVGAETSDGRTTFLERPYLEKPTTIDDIIDAIEDTLDG